MFSLTPDLSQLNLNDDVADWEYDFEIDVKAGIKDLGQEELGEEIQVDTAMEVRSIQPPHIRIPF